MTDYSILTDTIAKRLALGKPLCLAVDGVCASGKSTHAEMLAKRFDGAVIHTDDFFLPAKLRTPERYGEPGGNIDYDRFLSEVAPHLRRREAFSYRRFDCAKMKLADEVAVPAKRLFIVEGAYSMHPKFSGLYDITVGLSVPRKTQLLRIEARDGKEALSAFEAKWMPLEEKYLDAFEIFSKCDFVFGK